jgi:hypothetical protein
MKLFIAHGPVKEEEAHEPEPPEPFGKFYFF